MIQDPNCQICKIPIKRYYKLCTNCYFNKDLMISSTEAKKIYKLTDDDLIKSKLFSVQSNFKSFISIKYIRAELYEYVKNLIMDLPYNDIRKIAFTKLEEAKEQEFLFAKRRASLLDTVNNLMIKLDVDKQIELQIEPYINKLIDSYANDPDIRIFDTSVIILEKISDEIQNIKNLQRRKEMINELIEKLIDKKDWNKAKTHPKYLEFTDKDNKYNVNPRNLNAYFTEIKNNIDEENLRNKQIAERKKSLDEWITNKFGIDGVDIAKNHEKYNGYLYQEFKNKNMTFYQCRKDLSHYIKIIKGRDERKIKMDNWLVKNVSAKYMSQIGHIYNNFIKNGDITDIEETKNNIRSHIDYIIGKDERLTIITNSLANNGIILILGNYKLAWQQSIVQRCIEVQDCYIRNMMSLDKALNNIYELWNGFNIMTKFINLVETEFQNHKDILKRYTEYSEFMKGDIEINDISCNALIDDIRQKIEKANHIKKIFGPNCSTDLYNKFVNSTEYTDLIKYTDIKKIDHIIKKKFGITLFFMKKC